MPEPFVDISMGDLLDWQQDDQPSAPARPAVPRRPQPPPNRDVNPVLVAEFNNLQWTRVNSSNLDYVSYAPGIGRLWVWFKRGGNSRYSVYAYDHVPQAVYDGMMAAASHGSYFARHIRNAYAVTPIA